MGYVLRTVVFWIQLADQLGIVPVFSSERFFSLRPGDALLAHIFFFVMEVALVAALALIFFAQGLLMGLLALLYLPPLFLLCTALLLRLTLETLLLLGRE